MYSIAFPNMFITTGTRLLKDKDATMSNLKLLLSSVKGTLFGDPDFGTDLVSAVFNQNSQVLVDLLIDEIYTTITQNMPQIGISRKSISITSDGVNVYANLQITNKLDYTTNLYQINLTNTEFSEEQ